MTELLDNLHYWIQVRIESEDEVMRALAADEILIIHGLMKVKDLWDDAGTID